MHWLMLESIVIKLKDLALPGYLSLNSAKIYVKTFEMPLTYLLCMLMIANLPFYRNIISVWDFVLGIAYVETCTVYNCVEHFICVFRKRNIATDILNRNFPIPYWF